MHMITTTGALAAIKLAANAAVARIEQEYHAICDGAKYSSWQWFLCQISLSYPPSMRFYNDKERFLSGDDATQARLLRDVWHAIWVINDSCPLCEQQQPDIQVQLSAYTTEQVFLALHYLKIKLPSEDCDD